MRRVSKIALFSVLIVGLLALFTIPAGAQYPPPEQGVGVNATQGNAGGTLSGGCSGFQANTTCNVTAEFTTCGVGDGAPCEPVAALAAVTLAQTAPGVGTTTVTTSCTTDANGNCTWTLTIPANAVSGPVVLSASGTNPDGSPRLVTTTFDVQVLNATFQRPAAKAGAGDAGLPTTGGEFTKGAALAALALILGAALVVVGTRRSRADDDAYTTTE